MTRLFQVIAALIVMLVALPASAFADDWLVTRLKGQVLQLVAGDWAPLKRGDMVPDETVIRSLGSGRAMLQRGRETVEIASNTQIRIIDQESGKPFTTVQQFFGDVAIEAEVQNVQHFAVQTPYLAAVVKGTRFEVKTDKKQSSVKVMRGHVAVEDLRTGANTLLSVGQSAIVKKSGAFTVGGSGAKPQILNSAGQVISSANAAKGIVTVAVGNGSGVKVGVGGAVNVGVGGGAGVNANVNTGVVNGNVSVGGGNGVQAGADVGGGTVGVDVSAGGGSGVGVGADVGDTHVGVGVGGDSGGVSVDVGGIHIGLGGH